MTITTPRPGRQMTPANGIHWTVVVAGLWVGKNGGEFAGMIEAQTGGGFSATTHLAQHLGVFSTLDEAKASFTA